MTIVNSSFRPDLQFASSTNQQTDAENQKQAWLRQMEMSEMTLLQQLGSQNNPSSQKNSAQPESNHAESSERDAQDASKSSSDSPSASLLPVHPILKQVDAAAEHELSSINMPAPQMQNASVSADTTAIGAGALMQSAPTLSEQIANVVTEPVSAISELGHLAAFNFASNLNTPSEAAEHANSSDQPQKASNSDEQNNVEISEWQKRLIHVAQEGNDVSVSIRDSALDLHQSTQIVSRLAGDAAQSGLRLKNATVNGKTYVKLARNANSSNSSSNNSDLTSRLTSFIETQE